MKIKDIQTILVYGGWRNYVFVKVETDDGIVGWGEATLEGKARSVEKAIEDCKDLIIGWDPRDIEKIWRRLYRHSFWVGGPLQMSAIGGIETACWDILGKSLDQPVWRMLGGKMRDKALAYVNGWYLGAQSPDEYAERAQEVIKQGYRALKWDPFGPADLTLDIDSEKAALEQIRAIRAAVGPDVHLLIEAHARFNVFTAVRLARKMAPYDIYFFEEPVPPENEDAMRRVADLSPVQIATGEHLCSRHDVRRLLERHAVGILQADLIHVGGIFELKKIAAMAETYYVGLAPHLPNGFISGAATLQVDATSPSFVIQEFLPPPYEWQYDLVDKPLQAKDGYLQIPDGPGIGINLNEAVAAEHPYQPVEVNLYKTDWVESFGKE